MEHGKTEVFHFSRLHGIFDPPPLDLITLGGPILCPKNTWRYLGFIFERKLSFQQHIDFYTNKAISTVKCMKILGNSVVLFSIRSNFYIEVAFSLLSFTVFNYSSTTKYHYPILSKKDAKKRCNLDSWCFLYFAFIWYQGHCGPYSHSPTSSKA